MYTAKSIFFVVCIWIVLFAAACSSPSPAGPAIFNGCGEDYECIPFTPTSSAPKPANTPSPAVLEYREPQLSADSIWKPVDSFEEDGVSIKANGSDLIITTQVETIRIEAKDGVFTFYRNDIMEEAYTYRYTNITTVLVNVNTWNRAFRFNANTWQREGTLDILSIN